MTAAETVTIDLDDETDRWRYRCPQGHVQWTPTNHHFWCQQCADAAQRGLDVEPSFTYLRDRETGAEYDREAIRLTSEFGDWRDVRGETA